MQPSRKRAGYSIVEDKSYAGLQSRHALRLNSVKNFALKGIAFQIECDYIN